MQYALVHSFRVQCFSGQSYSLIQTYRVIHKSFSTTNGGYFQWLLYCLIFPFSVEISWLSEESKNVFASKERRQLADILCPAIQSQQIVGLKHSSCQLQEKLEEKKSRNRLKIHLLIWWKSTKQFHYISCLSCFLSLDNFFSSLEDLEMMSWYTVTI